DSDRNRIILNTISGNIVTTDSVGHILTATNPVRVPGHAGQSTEDPTLNSNPISKGSNAIFIGQLEAKEPMLLNAIIDGRLYQLTTTDSQTANVDFTEDNFCDGNNIMFSTPQDATDGIALGVAQGTEVSNNDIFNAAFAIRVGVQFGPQLGKKQFPGTCSLNNERLCLSDFDCEIKGIDLTGPQGSCIGVPKPMI